MGQNMNNLNELIIKEKDFTSVMEAKILPLLKEKIKYGYFLNDDGLKLHYASLINPEEKGSIVISHGFCEFISKYTETIYYFYMMGYSVFMVEYRGHGFSERLVDNLSKVHVKHFDDYVKDLNSFVEKIVKPESFSEHFYLFAHSMGGGVAARYLEKYPDVFEKAILSSPLIKVKMGKRAWLKSRFVCALSFVPFMTKRFVPGHRDYNHKYKYPKCSSMSEARYRFQYNEREKEHHFQTNGATFGWSREAIYVSKKILKNAHLIKIPVILMQASNDTLVSPEAQNEFCKRVNNCTLIRFEGSKHEIFNATDDIILEYYEAVFNFLNEAI